MPLGMGSHSNVRRTLALALALALTLSTLSLSLTLSGPLQRAPHLLANPISTPAPDPIYCTYQVAPLGTNLRHQLETSAMRSNPNPNPLAPALALALALTHS